MERDIARVKCLAQEHNTMTLPGLEPGTLDPESSALTIRPSRLPLALYKSAVNLEVARDAVFSIMVEARARRARASTIIDMVSHGFLGHFFCHHSNS